MQLLSGVLAIVTGVVVLLLLRRRFAARGERLLRRRYGALGDENARHITPGLYAFGGLAMIGLGAFWVVSFVWPRWA